MDDQRPCAAESKCEPFSHPVGRLDDVELRPEAASPEVPRMRALDARRSPRQTPTDLGQEAAYAPTVKMNTGARDILVSLSFHTRENMHLMPLRDESASHELGVRPDPTATGLGWILPRNEKDAQRSPARNVTFSRGSGVHGVPTVTESVRPLDARSAREAAVGGALRLRSVVASVGARSLARILETPLTAPHAASHPE